jgi:hypothetical protein
MNFVECFRMIRYVDGSPAEIIVHLERSSFIVTHKYPGIACSIKRVSLVFAILFVSDMHYSLILLSNNARMDAEQPFLPIDESKQN